MTDLLVTGSLWRDRRPEAPRVWLKTHRRVVEIVEPGSPVIGGSRVAGISYWQELREGVWVDVVGPGARRRTSVLRNLFLQRFEHVRGPS